MNCEKCGRPFLPGDTDCGPPLVCAAAAWSYRRGIRAGVEMAQAKIEIDRCCDNCSIDWSDVDAELARLMGGNDV
jgi:hypothetical protein